MDEMLEMGRQVLAAQPFSVLIGAELTGFAVGSAELKIPVKKELKQQHGFLHGGVVSYAADNALAYVGGSVLGPAVVTSEFKINYGAAGHGRLYCRAGDGGLRREKSGGMPLRCF